MVMFNTKNENRPSRTARSVLITRVLSMAGLLILLSALGMMFLEGIPPLIDGRGDVISPFVRGGGGDGGHMVELPSRKAVAKIRDVSDYEEVSDEQRNDELTGIVATTRIDVYTQSKGDVISHSTATENYEDGIIAKQNQRASSTVIAPLSANANKIDDCNGCIGKQGWLNASSVVSVVYVPNPEPIEQPALILVEKTQPSKSTNPVDQIILLDERHRGADWIADRLTECFDIKVYILPPFLSPVATEFMT